MATIDRVAVRIEGDASRLKSALTESSRASQRFASTATASFARVSQSFKTILGVGGALGFAALGTAAIRASDRVELGLRKIRIGTGRTREETARLERVFDNVFTRVPQDASEVGSAIESLNSVLGAQDEVLERLSKKVLDASRLMGEDGANNALLFARGMNQFGESAERGEEVIDALFDVSTRTGIGFGELIGLTNEYGSVLKNANFTIEESAELFGRLSASGLSVSRVSPGLNAAFRNWAKEGKNARAELGRVIEEMRSARTETEALAIAADAFGAEGAQRLTVAARSGALELNNLAGGADSASGAIEKANKSSETFSEVFGRILNKLSSIGGQGLALEGLSLFDRILGQIIEKSKSLIDNFRNFNTLSGIEERVADITGLSVETVRATESVEGLIEKFKELHGTDIVPISVKTLIAELDRARGKAQELEDDLEDGFGPLGDLLDRGGGGGKGGRRTLTKEQLKQLDKRLGEIKKETAPLNDLFRRLRELEQLEGATLEAGRVEDQFGMAKSAEEILAAEEALKSMTDTTRELNSVARELGLTFTSAFEDAALAITDARNAGEALRGVLQGLLQDIARFALRKGVTEPVLNALSAGISGGSSGFSFGNFSSVLSGFPDLNAPGTTFSTPTGNPLAGTGAAVLTGQAGGGGFLSGLTGLFGGLFGGAAEGAFIPRRGIFELAEDEPEFVIPLSKVTGFFTNMTSRMMPLTGFAPSASRSGGPPSSTVNMGGVHFHGVSPGDFRRSDLQVRATIAQGVREGQRGL